MSQFYQGIGTIGTNKPQSCKKCIIFKKNPNKTQINKSHPHTPKKIQAQKQKPIGWFNQRNTTECKRMVKIFLCVLEEN